MIRIRPANASDEAAILNLVQEFPTPTHPAADVVAAVLRAKLVDDSSYLLVAADEDVLVGYVSGYRHAAFYAAGQTAWVDELLVTPTYRRRGIGRLLMKAFEELAAADECRLVSLATASAGPFYAGLGYESKAGYYKKYLSTPNTPASRALAE